MAWLYLDRKWISRVDKPGITRKCRSPHIARPVRRALEQDRQVSKESIGTVGQVASDDPTDPLRLQRYTRPGLNGQLTIVKNL